MDLESVWIVGNQGSDKVLILFMEVQIFFFLISIIFLLAVIIFYYLDIGGNQNCGFRVLMRLNMSFVWSL